MITSQRLSDGVLIFLPLCPSTNARMRPVRMGGMCREILTSEARSYIQSVGLALKLWARAEKFQPIDVYSWVDLWFILPRTNCDAHNLGKVLFDALEVGRIVTREKNILPRVIGIWHDDENPQAVVKLPSGRRKQVDLFMDTPRFLAENG